MNIFAYLRRHAVVAGAAAFVVVAGTVIAGRAAHRSAATATAGNDIKQVSLVSASLFRQDASHVLSDGLVESAAQVDLKSQVSAPVARVNVSVGDSVSSGETLLTLRNADIQAQLDQAKASLALAKGQYNTGSVSVYSAKKAAIDKVRDSYLAADVAVRTDLDQFLFNTAADEAPLSSYVSDYKLADDLRTTRTDLTNDLDAWKKTLDALSPDTSTDTDIRDALSFAKTTLDKVIHLLDDVSTVLNEAVKNAPSTTLTTLNGWKTTVSGARTAVNAASVSVTSVDMSYLSALATHGSPAEAQISVAQAGVENLEAQLEKTIITSPIAGKVAAVPLREGELATPGQLLATVVGGGGLEIKAYVSAEDLGRIKKGADVLVGDSVIGKVESAAPSVSETNRRAEVVILVSNPEKSGLVVGQSVSVSIAAPVASSTVSAGASYFLPIQDVKILPGEAYVFTADENSKVVSHPVTLGAVRGDFVEVKGGLDDSMRILTPVYELEEGQAVDVR